MVAVAFVLAAAAGLHRAAVVERSVITRREYDDALNLTRWASWAVAATLIVTTVAVILWHRSTSQSLGIPSAAQDRRGQTSAFASPPSRSEQRRRLNRGLDGLPGVHTWRTRTGLFDVLLAVVVVIGQLFLLRHTSTLVDLATMSRSAAGVYTLAGVVALALAWCRWQFMSTVDVAIGQLATLRSAG